MLPGATMAPQDKGGLCQNSGKKRDTLVVAEAQSWAQGKKCSLEKI